MRADGQRTTGFGPGLLVTAAFIGPGTLTTASVAGARFGYTLLWAAAFSVLATLVLQEMAARLGAAGRCGLGTALRTAVRTPLVRGPLLALVAVGIGGGNAAFQTGNVLGAAVAVADLSGTAPSVWAPVIGGLACTLLWSGTYAVIERALMLLVAVMGGVFLVTAALAGPPPAAVLSGLLTPGVPPGSLLTILALIGTTVVPYNLFLHASAAHTKWRDATPAGRALRTARADTCVSVGLGGLFTLAILATAAATFFRHGVPLDNAADMAAQLEPLAGRHARLLFAIGLFAAGLTSAITAPLAAAYAVAETLGWPADTRAWRFRLVWGAVVLVGTWLAWADLRPLSVILAAQAVNACLLPVLAGCLLAVMNRRDVLGAATNGPLANLAGGAVLLVVAGLGVVQFLRILG